MNKQKTRDCILVICFSILMFSCGAEKKGTEVEPLSIISFNIRYDNPDDGEHAWENRKEACLSMFKELRPDIFGLQEALETQLEYLKDSLSQYQTVGLGRDPKSDKNEYCPVFFLKDKFELLDSKTFWLSETPEMPSKGWDSKYNRIATWVHLKDRKTSKEVIYLNTHFDHKGKLARYESSKLLIESLKSIGENSVPILVSGDFNALPNDSLFIPIKDYLQDLRMTVASNDSMQTTNGWGTEPPSKVIDYIFFKQIEPVSYTVITKNYSVPYISDHYPILGTFKY